MSVVYAYHWACVLGLLAFAFSLNMSPPAVAALLALVTTQTFNVLLLAGLTGRSAISGILQGVLLTIISIVAFSELDVPLRLAELRGLFFLPAYLTLAVLPLLAARFRWGWQFINHTTDQIPRSPLGMEDFFLLTASAAGIWILLRDTVRPGQNILDQFVTAELWGSLLLLMLFSVVILGLVYLLFRRRLGIGAIFFLLLAALMPHHLLFAMLSDDWLLLLVAPLSAVGCALGLAVHKFAGNQLVRYADRTTEQPDSLNDEEVLILRRGRRSARISVVILMLVAIALTAMCWYADSQPQVDPFVLE